MRVCHISKDSAEASGVYTFVVNLNNSLSSQGVASSIAKTYREYLLVHKSPPDIVHIHGLWVNNIDFLQAKVSKVKIVWSTHGMTAPWALHFKWVKKCLPWWLAQRWELMAADRIHCTSDAESFWNKSLGFVRTFVAPVGTRVCEPLSAVETRAFGERQLLFVGRVHPVKNIDSLIRAFAQVPSCIRAGWRLRIVGPGSADYRDELSGVAADCGVADVVDFVGPAYGDELARLYRESDCLALVSHTENFGATVVEALARGRPVITSKDTPWEVVEATRCGWWVENSVAGISSAISEMMSISPEERQEMGRRGHQLVCKRYTWDAVAGTVLAAYEEVLHER